MKYWVYMNGEVPGSYEAPELAAMPGFGEASMVCPVEGEAGERRWRRAGQHEDLTEALRLAARRPSRPAPPEPVVDAGEPGRPRTADEVLNDASARIFSHVSELMKELANRREERALTLALQRQIVELKNELMALRERNQYLSDRSELIPGFEDRERKLQEAVTRLRGEVQEADRRGLESSRRIDALRREGEQARADAAGLSEDLKRQTALADELTRQLAQKETALAKAFAIIRKLEQQLGQILPSTVAGIGREVPIFGESAAPPAPAPAAEPPPAEPPPEAEPAAREPEPAAAPENAVQAPPEAGITAREPAPQAPEPAPAEYAEPFDAVPPAESDPEAVTPVPAPWQSKLDRTLSYIKVLLLGSPRRPAPPPPSPEPAPPGDN